MAAFGFGNTSGPLAASAGVSQGPDLPEVQTEGLGFLSLAGESKVRLTAPWSPPAAANASLMSIASRRGLVAAAGPDAVVVASTEAVRKAFESPKDGGGDNELRSFEPQLKLPLPIRICQLAFTADESYLVLAAELPGGLAVYECDAIQQGSNEPAFEIPTNGESLRVLAPNPSLDKADLCAVVTTEGNLLVASLKERNFRGNGQVLRTQVSCAAWSNKGKQLVAGLGDGIMVQMTPDGQVKAEIPRPPGLSQDFYVATVVWLETDVFLTFHVSASDNPPQTACHLITRKGQAFQYQKLNDPVDAFGAEKRPHHSATRLKDFPPNLQDLLIISSTAVADIGLLARSKMPLSSDSPADVLANIVLANDSSRATLPMGEDFESPAAIGTALDLSSKDRVYKPIPTDETEQSPGPLPGYWALNDQGILSVWWIVYSESIRGGTTYPGLVAAAGNVTNPAPTAAAQPAHSSLFGAPSTSSFGSSQAAPAPAFGSASAIGAKSSPWGTPSTASGGMGGGAVFGSSTFGSAAASTEPKFGAPSFGSSSFGTTASTPAAAPAFGQPSGPGLRASPWGSGASATGGASFGQSGFPKSSATSGGVFGSSNPSNTGSTGGFAGFASKGGFGSVASNNSTETGSIFASKSSAPEVSMDTGSNTAFPPKANTTSGTAFGSPFTLTSSFKPDPDTNDSGAADDKPSAGAAKSMFGSGFASSMDESVSSPSQNPFGSGSKNVFGQPTSTSNVESTTPTTTPAPGKFLSQTTTAPQSGGLFSFTPKTTGGLFDFSTSQTPKSKVPEVKTEPETPRVVELAPEEAPLPPESTSKATYPLGDSSSSSATADTPKGPPSRAEEVPLPSDSIPLASTNTGSVSPAAKAPAAVNEAPLPPDPVRNKSAYSAPLPPLPGAATKPKTNSEAPLPPDPVKNKNAYKAPLPPLPGASAQPKVANSAPLPPDPTKQPKAYENKVPALPIDKSVSGVAGPGFKFPTNPPPIPSDSDDDDFSDEGDEDEVATEAASEGSGVDVAKEISPSTAGVGKTPGFTPQSSFDGLAGSYSTISRPDHDRGGLFGELGRNAPAFPQPNPTSPRSPSPVRRALPARMVGSEQARSFSAPGMASQILGGSRKPQSRMGVSIVGRDNALENAVIEQQRQAKEKKEAEEAQLLIDEEDDAVQQILRADVEPALDLDEFIAHAGVPAPAGDSIPAQVEAVYRDINSMIDTLGLNARSLKSFIEGHKEYAADEVTRQDLNSPDDWTLGQMERLSGILEEDLGEALGAARVTGVAEKVSEIQDMQRELLRDRNKQTDLKKTLATRLDPDQHLANRALPLSAEQAAQQSDLRREFARFTKLISDAEQGLTLLKAKMASAGGGGGGGADGNGRGGGVPAPTIEAVVRTITKMTSMVERRSGDIDVLENQMRKLRLGSAAAGAGAGGSREGSPFATTTATPGARQSRLSSSMTTAALESRSTREGTPQRGSVLRHSLSSSMSGLGLGPSPRTPPRRKLNNGSSSGGGGGFIGDAAERSAVREKSARRAAVLGRLKASLEKKGPAVVGFDSIA
ncbi:hypothetical protein GGR56DRAFT_680810 [Xylariaceae sp. FL0804]|nr:hypothetical protein GGR56DRAFT_680810 [Xylariaceae sp. FL0804]